MPKKREVPQETVTEEIPDDSIPTTESDDPDAVLEAWPELQRLLNGESVEDFFDKGWRPSIKSKPNGKKYITFRLHGRDPNTGEIVDYERGLGVLDPENPIRYDVLKGLVPQKNVTVPDVLPKSQASSIPTPITNRDRSSVLTTKVGRIAPIGPSVQIKLGTLQWYTWVQTSAGYPGSLDDFINQSVDTLFRDHYKLELAVVNQREENQ